MCERRVQCGRRQARQRDSSVDSLATYSKTDCHLKYASPSSLPASSNTSCLHHHHHQHQHQQQQLPALAHHCTASPHRDPLTHCQPALCLHSRRRCCHGDASVCRCIYACAGDDDQDSDTPRCRRRAKPLLAADTDTQTDGETDDKPPDDTDHPASAHIPLATQRLLMTSSDQLPVASDDVITACRAAELIAT